MCGKVEVRIRKGAAHLSQVLILLTVTGSKAPHWKPGSVSRIESPKANQASFSEKH